MEKLNQPNYDTIRSTSNKKSSTNNVHILLTTIHYLVLSDLKCCSWRYSMFLADFHLYRYFTCRLLMQVTCFPIGVKTNPFPNRGTKQIQCKCASSGRRRTNGILPGMLKQMITQCKSITSGSTHYRNSTKSLVHFKNNFYS